MANGDGNDIQEFRGGGFWCFCFFLRFSVFSIEKSKKCRILLIV